MCVYYPKETTRNLFKVSKLKNMAKGKVSKIKNMAKGIFLLPDFCEKAAPDLLQL